jgi:hypothetical protein
MPVDYAPVKATVSQLIKEEMKKKDVIGRSTALWKEFLFATDGHGFTRIRTPYRSLFAQFHANSARC